MQNESTQSLVRSTEELIVDIRSHHYGAEQEVQNVHNAMGRALRHAYEAGKLLVEAKEQLGHGRFGAFQQRLDLPPSTVSLYTMLFNRVGDDPSALEAFRGKSDAYKKLGIINTGSDRDGDDLRPPPLPAWVRTAAKVAEDINGSLDDIKKDRDRQEAYRPLYLALKRVFG